MPDQPLLSTLHIDQFLTNLSIGYLQEPGYFVADQVAPIVPSAKRSNKIPEYNLGDLYRDIMTVREAGAESSGGGFKVSSDSFFCDVWATHQDVDDLTVAGADMPYDVFADATRRLVQAERIKRDVQFAAAQFTTSVWTGGTATDPTAASLSAKWSDPSSTPIEDIHTQADSILTNTGYLPNTLVVNNLGWFALKNHPDIVDRVKYTSSEPITTDYVARVLGLDNIYVARGQKTSSKEGATDTFAAIFGKNALLVYVASSPGLWQPSGAYTFVWTGYPGGTDGRLIRRFRVEVNRSTRVELEAAFTQKVIQAKMGVFIQTVV